METKKSKEKSEGKGDDRDSKIDDKVPENNSKLCLNKELESSEKGAKKKKKKKKKSK